jgi:selenocysteine-specific elongation factor
MTVVIGTAGHIDHGKTTLLRALTGIDADRLPEERRRGMTIDVGYAHLALSDGTELDFIDVPGHDRLVGNMLVGAGEIDAALLVVAADDGPRAQTVEHLALLDGLAIRNGIAVVTKSDLAGPERTAEVTEAVRRLLAGSSLAGAPVLAVTATNGDGIDALRVALATLRDTVLAASRPRPSPSGARLAIDRVFSVKGRGVVVTGTMRGTGVAPGAVLRVVPGDRSVRVRDVQVHGAAVARAGPGRAALNLAGADGLELHRGQVLTDDPAVGSSDRILVTLARPLSDRARARVHLGTGAVDGTVGRSGRDALDLSDGTALAIIRLSAPLGVAAGDRLVLRRTGGPERIVGALVIDGSPAHGVSRRRQTPERVERLATAVASGDDPAARAARLDLHGVSDGAGGADDGMTAASDVAAAVDAAIIAAVRAAPRGEASLDDLRAVAARVLRREATLTRSSAAALATHLVTAVIDDGRLERDGAIVRLPGTGSAPPDPHLEAAMDRLERSLAVAAPPGLADAARAAGCPTAGIRELERRGRIVVLDANLAYAAGTYQGLADRALALAAQAPLTPAALRDATGTSRKYVMAILADLDRRGILRRVPDGHLPGPRAAVGSGTGRP